MWEDPSKFPFEEGKYFVGTDPNTSQWIGVDAVGHALTFARTQTGKGASVIIPNLLHWPHNALVIDPKGEAVENTWEERERRGQTVHVLDPFGEANIPDRLRASYNHLDILNPKSATIREDINVLSDGIIMRSSPKDAVWDDGGQTIVGGMIAYVKMALPEREQNLLSVRAILRDESLLQEVVPQLKTLTGCGGLCQAAYSRMAAKEGDYYLSNAQSNTEWLDSEGMKFALSKSTFSMADLKSGNTSIFLVLPAGYLKEHGRFLRLMVRCGIDAMSRRTPDGALRDKDCLFILDEFFALGYISEIAVSSGLMAGFGLHLWPFLQSMGQLLDLYGENVGGDFFSNADFHQFFAANDERTLTYISRALGNYTIQDLPDEPKFGDGPMGREYLARNEIWEARKNSIFYSPAASQGLIMRLKLDLKYAEQEWRENMSRFNTTASRFLGKPRLAPDQVGQLIAKTDRPLANHAIIFTQGMRPILSRPRGHWELHTAKALEPPEIPVFWLNKEDFGKRRTVLLTCQSDTCNTSDISGVWRIDKDKEPYGRCRRCGRRAWVQFWNPADNDYTEDAPVSGTWEALTARWRVRR